MIRRSLLVIAGLAMILALVPTAFAQTTAQMQGLVTDTSGGALPGAEVTVTQTETGMTRFVITGAKGDFVFTNLPVGPYKLAAKMPSFSPFEQSGIVLAIGDNRALTIKLSIGGVAETVKVTADANLVETRSLSIGTLVSQDQLVGLPLNGRSATQLILLAGGAVDGGGLTDDRQPAGAVAISVAGGTGNSTMYLVDGGYNNDPQNNTGNAIPFPDALQEFRADTGVRDARFGMSTGATVNAVTKSGTNAYHGSVFEFARNYRFNSKAYFERVENGGLGRNDGLKRHQFGGTFGGPLMKDKLFFFEGIQVTKNFNVPLNSDVTVPTAEVLAGDLRRIMSAACRSGTARTLGAPFVNNQVSPTLFNPISLKVLAMVPVADPANDPDGCGRYVARRPNDQTDQQYVTRVDYQMTTNKRIFVRHFLATNTHPALWDETKPNLLDTGGQGRGLFGKQNTIATGLDYVVTQHLFASTRFTYQSTFSERRNKGCVPTWGILGVKVWNYTNSVDANGVQGCSKYEGQGQLKGGLWSSANTGRFYVYTPSLSQDFDWTRGAHSLSFGGSWTRPHADGDGTFAADGSIGFSGLYTSGNSQSTGGLNMADFVLGYPSSYSGAGSQTNNAYVHSVGTYFNDSWRLSRRMTVNMGVRWEPFISVKDKNGYVTAFSREAFDKGYRSKVYVNAPVGLLFRGDDGFPNDGGNTKNYWKQVAPRAGIVWDPAGDNRQTIRAGVGLYFDSPKLWTTAHHMLNAPFGNDSSATHALVASACPGKPFKGECPLDFSDPWKDTVGGDPQANLSHMGYPVVLAPHNVAWPGGNPNYVSMPVDSTPMNTVQYDLSYQRQIAGMLVDATYAGSRTENIWVTGFAENPIIYIAGNCVAGQYGLTAAGACSNTDTANRNARRLLTLLNPTEGPKYLGGVAQLYPEGYGRYNSLKLSLTRRMANNWSATANYTISKCINNGEPGTDIGSGTYPGIGNLVETGSGQVRDYLGSHLPDPKSAEGYCNADRKHLLNVTSIVISPGLGSGFLRTITKDWQVGLILQARSGSHITAGSTGDNTLTNGNQRAVIVPGVDPYLAEADRTWVANSAGANTMLRWLNPAAFTVATPGTWGNAKRNDLTGPSFWNADLAFSRNLNLPRGRRVEIRVEAFNLFDTVNWSNPSISAASTSVSNGMVTSTSGQARIMQFALKYGF